MKKEKSIRSKLKTGINSPVRTYMGITIGQESYLKLFVYELYYLILASFPGAIGIFLRQKACRWLVGSVGKNVVIGRNVIFRSPHKIRIGNSVTIDDNCLLEARGSGVKGVVIEDNVIINRNCMIQAKAGPIRIGKSTSIGSYSIITSLAGVDIGEFVLTGGRCYFSAGAYGFEDLDKPIIEQGPYAKGPITIGAKSYFGAGAMVVGGITVGVGAVAGAGSVVLKDIDNYAIVAGVPAKLLRYRS